MSQQLDITSKFSLHLQNPGFSTKFFAIVTAMCLPKPNASTLHFGFHREFQEIMFPDTKIHPLSVHIAQMLRVQRSRHEN